METETASPLEGLIQTLDHPETHILPLLHSKESAGTTRNELLQTCQFLFQEIEGLAKSYQSLRKKDADETPPGLSGLSELYVSDGAVDVETIWGQVDLQNDALKKLLKKSVKNLGKSADDICVLDMGEVFSEDEEEQNSDDDDDSDNQEEKSGSEEEVSDEEDDVDEETKRIRERMEQALDDMGSDQEEEEDSDQESESDEKAKAVKSKKSEEEDLVDPAAEELNDGFFDINEMEDFADEEEEYLPEEAFGQPRKEKKTLEKKSFHQKQRDGDMDSGSDEDGDEDEEFEEEQVVRRKKYREDDEIDALHDLYNEPESEEEEEEDEEGDIVNMTAADLFGKPNKKFYEQYKKKPRSEPSKPEKGDDDSWGEYDFEKEDQSAWRDDHISDDEADEDKEEDASGDEEEAMDAMDDEEIGSSKNKNEDNSKHARQEEKLRRQTEQLEKELLAEKPWQMTGEAKGTSRPVNSLLEGTPEFQVASKQAPTITIEHTTNLEDIIKQRVIAEDWDDLVPRELPDVGWHKNRGELPEVSQEKSKLGLGELYEREYLKKAVGYDVDAAEKQTEEDKARNEMKQLFANLCSKLDALSNYHFAPRPIADEAEVRPITTPAIAMEEVLPLHVSDARGVAPEEVYGAKRGRDGILRGETEMDQTERKRMRMSKKSARRKVRKEKLADEKLISRLEPGLGLNNPYEKRKIREELTEARAHGRVTTGEKEAAQTKYGSSGTFFKRLQTEAQESIRDNTPFGEKKEEKVTKPKSSSYKL